MVVTASATFQRERSKSPKPRAGISNSRPADRMRPAKALIVARDALFAILKI